MCCNNGAYENDNLQAKGPKSWGGIKWDYELTISTESCLKIVSASDNWWIASDHRVLSRVKHWWRRRVVRRWKK